ncbi:uncharacterized [Tachysurus ichikawai]
MPPEPADDFPKTAKGQEYILVITDYATSNRSLRNSSAPWTVPNFVAAWQRMMDSVTPASPVLEDERWLITSQTAFCAFSLVFSESR